MMTMHSYDGIIFDFNGTLVWDTGLHEKAWIAFSDKIGNPVDVETYYRDIHGKTTKNILEMLLGHEVDENEIAELSREKEALYRKICLENPQTFVLAPGVEEFLDYVRANEIPMNIATASEIENVEFFIEYFSLEKWFDISRIVYDDGKVANKPEPDIYIQAAKNLGIAPERLVMIEDSYSGIVAASRSGCGYLIATGEPTRNHQNISKHPEVDQLIVDFSEIDKTMLC